MKITKASDYAIRLMTHLAAGEEATTSEELARKLDIPFNHLAKLVQVLAKRRYLITRKGKGGGLRLAVDPKQINLAEVIEAIEGPLVISECIFHRETCCFSGECKVRKCLSRIRYQLQETLMNTTIHDLAPAT
ncbi:RrF2 family transcriptional regulator [Candidatus Margulisiibacteriota bacterium]